MTSLSGATLVIFTWYESLVPNEIVFVLTWLSQSEYTATWPEPVGPLLMRTTPFQGIGKLANQLSRTTVRNANLL